MALGKNQVKKLARIFVASLIDRELENGNFGELSEDERLLFRSELTKIADRLHWKKFDSFGKCHEAVSNDVMGML